MRVKSVSHQLRKYYLLMILLTTTLTILGVIFLASINSLEKQNNIYTTLSAPNIIKDDYSSIDTSKIEKMGGGLQVINSNYRVLYSKGKRIFDGEQITPKEFSDYLVQCNKENEIVSVAYSEKQEFWLIVALPIAIKVDIHINLSDQAHDHNTVRMVGMIFLTFFAFLLISILIYSKITSRFFIQPLIKLCKSVELFREGDYSARTELQGSKEFLELQKTFNCMAEQIQNQVEQKELNEQNRKKLMMDISHDLKNPLMSIVGFAEMIPQEMNHKQIEEYANIILSNGYRANELIVDLFELAQMENPEFELRCENTDFTEYFRSEIIRMLPELEKSGLAVDIEIPEKQVMYTFDCKKMRRVISNLLFNAISYCGGHGNMVIRMEIDDENIKIIFANTVTLCKDEHIGDKEKSCTNNDYYHVGLGLSIVKKIISLHSGQVIISENTDRSFEIQILLPIGRTVKKQ